HRFRIGADSRHVAPEGGFAEDKTADHENHHGDDRRQRQADDPAAADGVERALGIDRDGISPGEQQGRASNGAQPRQGHDEGRDASVMKVEVISENRSTTRAKNTAMLATPPLSWTSKRNRLLITRDPSCRAPRPTGISARRSS